MEEKLKKLYDKDDKLAYQILLELSKKIEAKLKKLDLSKYKESVQSLIERDIEKIIK